MFFIISSKKSIILTVLFLFVALSTGYATNQTSSGVVSSQVGTDPNTGAANVSVPIETPPGRNGMAPNLALSYNSNKRNGWIGIGWDIKTSFIQRNTKWGLDYSDDDYVADGNRELAARGDWGTDYYGHKTEGSFIKYFYNSTTGGWEATTKNGTRHYYGTTAASRQVNANDSSEVFKWMIDKVEDTNGNYVTYKYTKDQGEIYLEKIDYTGGSGLSPSNYVKFYYDETRTDAPVMYTTNFPITTAKRLMTIEVVSDANIVSAYSLDYTTSGSTSQSILSSIQQFGIDATLDGIGMVTGGTALPAIVPEYFTESNGTFAPFMGTTHATSGYGSYWNFAFADVNGDGKTDAIAQYIGKSGGNGTRLDVALSNGDGTFASFVGTTHATSGYGSYWKFAFADVNGDGMADAIAHYIGSTSGTRLKVALSNGDGTFAPFVGTTHATSGYGSYWNFAFADVNGDGMADAIAHYIGGASGTRLKVALSNGDGTFASFVGTTHATSGYGSYWNFAFADVNGDGKADAIAQYIGKSGGNGTRLDVALSNGDGTFASFKGTTHATSGYGSYWKFAFADVNGDGMADAIAHYIGGTSGTRLDVALSSGDGTFASFKGTTHATSGYGSYWNFAFADVNGDGKADAIAQYIGKSGGNGTRLDVALSNGGGTFTPFMGTTHTTSGYGSYWNFAFADFSGNGKSDAIAYYIGGTSGTRLKVAQPNGDVGHNLLSSLSNGVGGTTTITYKPSSQYDNDVFPLIIQTVSSISVNDGNGNTSTTDYTYAGGLFDFDTRELRGFEYVKSTDPAGTTSETWFHQDAVFKGLPYKTEIKDSSGNLYSKSEKTYDSASPYTGVDFPYLEQSNDYVYDGTATANEVSTTFAYDAYGNITEKHLGGDTAISGDERDEYIEYNYDTTNWLVSLPNHTYVNNSTGTKVSEAWFAYDANGNLLTETTWNDSGPDPVITYTYDNYGNQESIKDPNNLNTSKTTNITYDSTHTFPYQATNPLGHTATTVYDPGIGKVISETGPNGNTTTYDYDVFGRMTKVTNPLDTGSQYGTASYEYQDCGTANLRVVTYSTEESGTANHIRSEVCLDGLERTV
ncbi:MAG: hypothetical protein GY727_05185, partial [Gammaproteobacteria bacterium]|nr:hypothetical protein [Gammaproteobacteria bacterium]